MLRAVGQFKALTEWAEQDKAVCETLKRVLKLTRGWDVARDHARMAVGTDSRMRLWYAADGQSGLLYKCNLGSVELDQPVGKVLGCLVLTPECGTVEIGEERQTVLDWTGCRAFYYFWLCSQSFAVQLPQYVAGTHCQP